MKFPFWWVWVLFGAAFAGPMYLITHDIQYSFLILIGVSGFIFLSSIWTDCWDKWQNKLLSDADSVLRRVLREQNKYGKRLVQYGTKLIDGGERTDYPVFFISVGYSALHELGFYSRANYFLKGIRIEKDRVSFQRQLFRKVSEERMRKWLDVIFAAADELEAQNDNSF